LAGDGAEDLILTWSQLHAPTGFHSIDSGRITPERVEDDKFALILPETGVEGALILGRRIAERLAADVEKPALSCSSTASALFGTICPPACDPRTHTLVYPGGMIPLAEE
jgi:hypothetical protein